MKRVGVEEDRRSPTNKNRGQPGDEDRRGQNGEDDRYSPAGGKRGQPTSDKRGVGVEEDRRSPTNKNRGQPGDEDRRGQTGEDDRYSPGGGKRGQPVSDKRGVGVEEDRRSPTNKNRGQPGDEERRGQIGDDDRYPPAGDKRGVGVEEDSRSPTNKNRGQPVSNRKGVGVEEDRRSPTNKNRGQPGDEERRGQNGEDDRYSPAGGKRGQPGDEERRGQTGNEDRYSPAGGKRMQPLTDKRGVAIDKDRSYPNGIKKDQLNIEGRRVQSEDDDTDYPFNGRTGKPRDEKRGLLDEDNGDSPTGKYRTHPEDNHNGWLEGQDRDSPDAKPSHENSESILKEENNYPPRQNKANLNKTPLSSSTDSNVDNNHPIGYKQQFKENPLNPTSKTRGIRNPFAKRNRSPKASTSSVPSIVDSSIPNNEDEDRVGKKSSPAVKPGSQVRGNTKQESGNRPIAKPSAESDSSDSDIRQHEVPVESEFEIRYDKNGKPYRARKDERLATKKSPTPRVQDLRYESMSPDDAHDSKDVRDLLEEWDQYGLDSSPVVPSKPKEGAKNIARDEEDNDDKLPKSTSKIPQAPKQLTKDKIRETPKVANRDGSTEFTKKPTTLEEARLKKKESPSSKQQSDQKSL